MPRRNRHLGVTGMYGRIGAVARHALRDIQGRPRGHVASPAEALARIDAQRHALDAVRGLPEPYRSALFHCRIEGLEPEEVARRLGVPAATVAARLRHALRLLGELPAGASARPQR